MAPACMSAIFHFISYCTSCTVVSAIWRFPARIGGRRSAIPEAPPSLPGGVTFGVRGHTIRALHGCPLYNAVRYRRSLVTLKPTCASGTALPALPPDRHPALPLSESPCSPSAQSGLPWAPHSRPSSAFCDDHTFRFRFVEILGVWVGGNWHFMRRCSVS